MSKKLRWNRLGPLMAATVLGLAAGCSLLLDFTECDGDDGCQSFETCSDGVCVVSTGTNNVNNGTPEVSITENIGEDTTWTRDNVYVLEQIITVGASTTLTIEPGTLIKADPSSALVVRAGGRLEAKGERDSPIVFTSSNPVGRRQPGDWGGVAMLGRAPVNRDNFALRVFDDETQRPIFGGDVDDWNCGTLEYVRIEFGGGPVEGAEALNGLIVGGCGTDTTIEHVQIHASADDGFEIFGGTFDFRRVVLTRNGDDAIDIDTGWTGTGQYLAVQQDASGENAVEVDNLAEEPDKTPLTDFRIYNYTLIGAGEDGATQAFTFKAGGGGFLSHGIIMGHRAGGLDVVGAESGARAMNDEIIVEHSLWFDVGSGGTKFFPAEADPGEIDAETADGGFDEQTYYTEPIRDNRLDSDPQIDDAFNLADPGWVPPPNSNVTGVDPPPEGFDPTGVYLGAFAPDSIPWTEDWTSYPAN